MQYIHREMRSPGEALVKNHIEEERDRLCREQEIKNLEEEYRAIRGDRGWKETPMQ